MKSKTSKKITRVIAYLTLAILIISTSGQLVTPTYAQDIPGLQDEQTLAATQGRLFLPLVFRPPENASPTAIHLSSTTFPDLLPAGTEVGAFTTSDPNPGDSFTYTLVAGEGSTDNMAFTVSLGKLYTAIMCNYDVKNSYNIRVRSTDKGGLYTEKSFVLSVIDVDDSLTWVNTSSRQASRDYYNQVYLASENVPIGWTGNVSNCTAGTTSQAFRDAVKLRINYFRAMAGISTKVTFVGEFNSKAQQAALMMSSNGQLSHNPPSSWKCYTNDGAEAAASSNLFLGVNGPSAISGYIKDFGDGNYAVGHRRWILLPQATRMGTGDIPINGSYRSANALWLFDNCLNDPRPPTREVYIAWPPPGYVPYQVIYHRWSFSYPGADFSSAAVSMTSGGAGISVALQPVVIGYGDNTLVWEPEITCGQPPSGDTAYNVTVSNVKINGVSKTFTYQVIMFDPGKLNGNPEADPLELPGAVEGEMPDPGF